jgi:radical SAM protein with 4Fe4S-binding SPASM domain
MREQNKEQQRIYILNPEYGIKEDKRRAIIFQRSIDPVQDKETTDILALMHPIYGIILSFFDGKSKFHEVIEKLSKFLQFEKAEIYNLISPLLENEKELHFKYDNNHFHLPRKVLIEKSNNESVEKIDIKKFFIPKKEHDFQSWRLYSPLDILFMINTICATDCIYCYADRSKSMDCQLPIERLKELIQEAKKLGIRSFDITGGEIFLYTQWEVLLRELVSNGFTPYLSTKLPIGQTIIDKLKDIGIKSIQISIDSIVKEELSKMLGIKDDYYEKLLETLDNLDKSGIEIYTNTQVTNINIDSIEKLIHFLRKLKNVRRINVGTAGFSLYNNSDYTNIRPDINSIMRLEGFVNDLKKEPGNNISYNFSGYLSAETYYNEEREKEKKFNERARCSGNFYALIIMPDGQVTICEELYFHPAFVIGNVNSNSIEEVWNSEKAIQLYKLSKAAINPKSACKKCDQFDECHQFRGVCWKEVLYAYGNENWDYPDPRCPKAPPPRRVFYLE